MDSANAYSRATKGAAEEFGSATRPSGQLVIASPSSSLRIIVSGMVGRFPLGGVAWDYLQYVVGLRRLGHDVFYHEDTRSWPYNPVAKSVTQGESYSTRFISDFFERHAPDCGERWHYRHLGDASYGMEASDFREIAKTADLFLNISGACFLPDELSPDCVTVFLDTDPGYNQIVLTESLDWSQGEGLGDRGWLDHDRHFTYAENIDGPDCRVPKVGVHWQTTRMPIVTSYWESLGKAPAGAPWTTVMSWNAFKGPLVHRGREYRSKDAEFEKIMAVPRRVSSRLQLAVGGEGVPLDRLIENGWEPVDGPITTLSPGRYRSFIEASRGEFSIAKQVYVALRTGWFSCRSACYLAARRPVVLQDTGFSRILPTGSGILAFDDLEGAVAALEAVERDYDHHCEAAGDLARSYFDSDSVLTDFIESAMVEGSDFRQRAEPA